MNSNRAQILGLKILFIIFELQTLVFVVHIHSIMIISLVLKVVAIEKRTKKKERWCQRGMLKSMDLPQECQLEE